MTVKIKSSEVNKISHNKFNVLSQNIVFILMSLVLAFFTSIPIIPALPFLKLDISDSIAFIATLMSGVSSGISILFTASIIRFMLFSSAGFAGFFIRITSVVLIYFIGYWRKKNINFIKNITILPLGIIICTAIKVPINYIFWIYIFGMPQELILKMMLPYIIPFNIFKASLNCAIAIIMKKPIENLFEKIESKL